MALRPYQSSFRDVILLSLPGLFNNRGARPGHRIRGTGLVDQRPPVAGLPANLYDAEWLGRQHEQYIACLAPAEDFDWKDVCRAEDEDEMTM